MEEVRAVRNCFARVDETEKLLATRRGENVSKLDVPAAGRFIAAAIGPAGTAVSAGRNARGSGGKMLTPPTAPSAHAAATTAVSDGEEEEEHDTSATAVTAAVATVPGGKRPAPGTTPASGRGAPPSKRRAGGADGGNGNASGHSGDATLGVPAAKPKSLDDKRRSTPQPRLSHLNWKEEMNKKFGRT